jgi:hypothetical protein
VDAFRLVLCEPGDYAISGGFTLLDTSIFRNFDVAQNDRESVSPTESGWIVSLVTSNVIELVGNVTVSCFDNSPPH